MPTPDSPSIETVTARPVVRAYANALVERVQAPRAPSNEQRVLCPKERALVRVGSRAPEDFRAVRTRSRIALHEVEAERLQVGRRACNAGAWRRGFVLHLLREDLKRAPAEGRLARQRLEEHDPDRVPVGGGGQRRRFDLLRCHVRRRPADLIVLVRGVAQRGKQIAHDPEKSRSHRPPFVRHHDVRRFDVPVDHPRRMQRDEPARELDERISKTRLVEARTSPRAAAAHVLDEVGSVDSLHREEPLPVLLDELAELHEIRVMEVLHGPKLTLEGEQRVRAVRPERLERDDRPLLAVVGLVDDAHPPFAESAAELEPARTAEKCARRQRSRPSAGGHCGGGAGQRQADRNHERGARVVIR